jgi:hypothetical protein
MIARLTCWKLVVLLDTFIVFAGAPLAARGDSSISFNGSTSKLQHTSANLLDGEDVITICAWVYPISQGENNAGTVVASDEAGSSIVIHRDANSTLAFVAKATITNGKWTVPVVSNAWSAVAFTYNNLHESFDPAARINFVTVTPTEITEPNDSTGDDATGYCVGNVSDGSKTWDGRIAHVQIFNRILTTTEMDACLQAPGSVTNGLRLWLPMTNAQDINDRGPNGYHGTATSLVTDVTGPMITLQPGVLPGIMILNPGYANITQHVIPRYANGVSYPAGQLRGVGPASIIRGTADTDDLPSNKRGIVITEDYDYASAQFQSDTETIRKAVLQAAVRDITIAGYDDTGSNYTSNSTSLVNNEPAEWNKIKGKITSMTGNGVSPIQIQSTNHTLQSGDYVTISATGNTAANGLKQIVRIDANWFEVSGTGNGTYEPGGTWVGESRWLDKYDGLLMRSSGLLVENVNFFYIPGTALVVKKGGAGSHTGPFLTFDREKARIFDCKVNRAYRGFLISDVDAVVGRLEGSDLRDYGIKFGTGVGTGAIQIDGALHFYRVGEGGYDQAAVWFAPGSGGSWGGPIHVAEAPIGVLLDSSANVLGPICAKSCTVNNIYVYGERNTVGPLELEVASAVAGVAIYNQFTKLLGGAITMTATSSVGVAVKGSGNGIIVRDVTFIGQSSSLGTAFTSDVEINNCTIDAHFENVGTGIDLYPDSVDRLGINNTIRITTNNVTNKIKLPPSIGASNNIWINGVKEE